jgi:hypothetical protein
MAPMTSENLRREVRIETRIPIIVVRGRRSIALETADVSYKGLFLCTDEPVSVRSLLRLKVSLPARDIEAHAMVVHVTPAAEGGPRGAGAGLQFWGLAGPDRIVWDEFVRERIQARRSDERRPNVQGPDSEPGSVGDRPTPSGVRMAPVIGSIIDGVPTLARRKTETGR